MKLIFAVIRDKDAGEAIGALNKAHIGVTKLSSTGGFLRDGNTTLMIGTEDDKVEAVMDILRENCAKRTEMEVVAPPGRKLRPGHFLRKEDLPPGGRVKKQQKGP